MENFIIILGNNKFIQAVIVAVILDTILGVLRAIKEKKFNSSAGINGAIRKVAMVSCIIILAIVDLIFNVNLLFMIPKNILTIINVNDVGICDFFCILFISYEAVSCMKNATLCGLPMPNKIRVKLEGFLHEMTEELPVIESESDTK